MTKLNNYFNAGKERLDASPFRNAGLARYIYRAEETDLDYLVTGKDIIELGRMLSRNVPNAYSHWCAGYGHELTSLDGWAVLDRVEAGDNFDDYDVGKITAVRRNLDHSENGAEVEVAWDSGVTTWQLGAGLRKEGTHPYLENEAVWWAYKWPKVMSIEPANPAKLKPEVKAWWLTELRRDDLEQGRKFLCQLTPSGVYQFCCWGLAAELYQHHNPNTRMIEKFSPIRNTYTYRDSLLTSAQSETEPTPKVQEWAFEPWDRTEDDDGDCIGFITVDNTVNWLIHMNDGLRKSFREIADWIEKNL